MAGQVKHRQIFSDVVPDLKLMGVLARLAFKNTDSLIGGVADALEREGIVLLPSTALLAGPDGDRGRHDPPRAVGEDELKDIEYGARGRARPGRAWTSARPWWSRTARRWPSRPWRAPTR